MIRSPYFNRATAILVAVSLTSAMGSALAPQISGVASAFQGQDIMGGAAIVFKRPQRVSDIVGGAAMLVVKRQTRSVRPQEVARNTPADHRKPQPRPGGPVVVEAKLSETDKAEAFRNH